MPSNLALICGCLKTCGRRAADVERAHGQLRARFADGLGGDDADRLAQLDGAPGGQVAPVAVDADAVLAFAGQHRANLDPLDAGRLNRLGLELVDLLVGARTMQSLGVRWDRQCRRRRTARRCGRSA